MKKAAASIVAATFILGSIGVPEPAIAAAAPSMDNANANIYSVSVIDSSSQIVAARRSGGRSGGRARSSSSRPAMRSPSSSSRSTVINRNTYISPSPRSVYVAPPVYGGGFGYGYNPFGFMFGLNAIGNVGRDMRDYRQEGEIQDTRLELERSRTRENELEGRLRQLEQGQTGLQQQQQFQQLQPIQQAPAAVAPAAVAPAATK